MAAAPAATALASGSCCRATTAPHCGAQRGAAAAAAPAAAPAAAAAARAVVPVAGCPSHRLAAAWHLLSFILAWISQGAVHSGRSQFLLSLPLQ